MEKDFRLLRPFDLEAAKRGDMLIDTYGDQCKYVAGPHHVTKEVVVEFTGDLGFITGKATDLRMAPLAWVEGKPVYKGDVLWHEVIGRVEVSALHEASPPCVEVVGRKDYPWISALTWTPPKVKREGWVNILEEGRLAGLIIHPSRKYADESAKLTGRIACVRIEWEEPAGQEGGAK